MDTVRRDFSTRFTGWSFIAAALMLWGGWTLLPHHIGTLFEPGDFAQVRENYRLWIWLFRTHFFGIVVTALALVALGTLLMNSPSRILVLPGAAVATAGLIVGAAGAAFYYHHGAWGAMHLQGKPPEELIGFVEALQHDTEYVTCLTRFSRVFTGLGLIVIGSGLIKWNILPRWTGLMAMAIGLVAIVLTMSLPEELHLYTPVFHVTSLWLLLMGTVILLRGIPEEHAK